MTWKNVPIPETIVGPLIVGIVLDFFFPQQLLQFNTIWLVLAFLFLGPGLLLMVWSVREAGRLEIASSDALITSGPYSFSRNPMYVSWISIYLSALFFNRSLWLFIFFFAALLFTHYLAVLREERLLHEKFGDTYQRYCERVRRYI